MLRARLAHTTDHHTHGHVRARQRRPGRPSDHPAQARDARAHSGATGAGTRADERARYARDPHTIPRADHVSLVLDRLNAGNVPYVITLDDVDETPALIVGTWTEPGCGVY